VGEPLRFCAAAQTFALKLYLSQPTLKAELTLFNVIPLFSIIPSIFNGVQARSFLSSHV
jgi:hypothetical protein